MGEILADNQAALAELFALASETVLGFPMPQIGERAIDAVVEELTYDEIMAAGGTGEGGGFSAIFKLTDLEDEIPASGESIVVRNQPLNVLTVKRNICFVTVTAGDPVANQ